MAGRQKKRAVQKLWQFIISVRLTIVLLIILSIVCIIGTVIPQHLHQHEYLKLYSESTYKIFKAAGFFDLYHAWWFILVMGVFTINLVCCSLNRLPGIWRLIFQSKRALDEQQMQNLPFVKKFTLKNFDPDCEQNIKSEIAGFLKNPQVMKKMDEWNFFSEKGRFTRFGFYLTHLGLLIILIGGISGALGFQGYMQLVEGETSDVVRLRNTNQVRKLDFSIRCDDFDVTYYKNSSRPKDYKSTLTVIKNGKEVVKQKIIEVNSPLIYEGICFYQSSYGVAPDRGGELVLRVTAKDTGTEKDYRVNVGDIFQLKGTGDEVRVDKFLPDFSMDGSGKAFTRSLELKNPAVQLTVFRNKKKVYSTWVFAKFPDFHKRAGQYYDFRFLHFEPVQYTGLQVTRDPGVWIVWTGCICLVVGIYLAFFTSHRRLWLKIQKKQGEFKALLAGSTNKNHQVFKNEFEILFKKLRS